MKSLRKKISRKKISSVAKFWDLLQGAEGAQSYEFSRMRAQFLLCQPGQACLDFLHCCQKLSKLKLIFKGRLSERPEFPILKDTGMTGTNGLPCHIFHSMMMKPKYEFLHHILKLINHCLHFQKS